MKDVREVIDSIPGIHRRTCRHCGASAFLTSDVSRLETSAGATETWIADCPGCGEDLRYTIAAGSMEPTESDVTVVGKISKFVEKIRKVGRAKRRNV